MFVKEELTDVEDDFQGTRQAAKRRQSFRFCRPCGAGTYMHTHTQRLRAGAMFSRRFAAWATARFQNFRSVTSSIAVLLEQKLVN